MEKYIFVLILLFCSLFEINCLEYNYVKCGLILSNTDDEQTCKNILNGTVTQGSFYSCSTNNEGKLIQIPNLIDGACCNMKCMKGKGELVLNQYSGKCCLDIYKSEEDFLFISMYFGKFNSEFNEAIGIIDNNFIYDNQNGIFKGNKILGSDWNMGDYACHFKSKEDLLNGLAYIMEGKFIYSYGGGHSPKGPTKGTIQNLNNKIIDDSNIIGFDCSGLVMFLLYNSGVDLCRLNMAETNAQRLYNFAKNKKIIKIIKNSDDYVNGNVLFYGKNENTIHHVSIALENGKMIEAYGHNSTTGNGLPIQIVDIRTKDLFAAGDFLGKTYECYDDNGSSSININENGNGSSSININENGNENENIDINKDSILYSKLSLIIMLVILFL